MQNAYQNDVLGRVLKELLSPLLFLQEYKKPAYAGFFEA